MIQDYALSQAPARLSTLLDHITAAVPNADVYVATILPFGNATDEAQGQSYNAQLTGIVAAKAAAGRHVHLVDMHAALTVPDLRSDGIHPTNGGYSRMAARWYGQLYQTSLTRWEAEAPGNTLVDSNTIARANASGDLKVGHIDNADSALEFNVSVAAAGAYRMYVRIADGTGTPCGHTVSANGQAARELSYPAYGWDQWAVVATEVSLVAGHNTIRFTHSTCYAELDSVDLAT